MGQGLGVGTCMTHSETRSQPAWTGLHGLQPRNDSKMPKPLSGSMCVVGCRGGAPRCQKPALTMPISSPLSTEQRGNLLVGLGVGGSPTLDTDHPVRRAQKRAISSPPSPAYFTILTGLLSSLWQAGHRHI